MSDFGGGLNPFIRHPRVLWRKRHLRAAPGPTAAQAWAGPELPLKVALAAAPTPPLPSMRVRKGFNPTPLSGMTSLGIPSRSAQFSEPELRGTVCDDLIQWFSVLAARGNHLVCLHKGQGLMCGPSRRCSNRSPWGGPGYGGFSPKSPGDPNQG